MGCPSTYQVLPYPLLARYIGRVIQTKREALHLSRAAVAEATPCHLFTLIRIEKGDIMPTVPELLGLAMTLESTLEELVGWPACPLAKELHHTVHLPLPQQQSVFRLLRFLGQLQPPPLLTGLAALFLSCACA